MSDNHPDEQTGPLSRLPGQQPDEPVGRRHPSPYPPPYTPPQQFAQYDPYPPATQPYPVTAPGAQNAPQGAGQYPNQAPAPTTRAKLPAWAWPAIAVLSLLLGLLGGGLAAALVVNQDGGSAGGVLGVERRTAAPLPADNGSIAAVADKVLPSAVQIVAEYQGSDNGATGSGFVFDKQGHVITNNHVVAEADKDGGPIEIIDQDGNHSKATVVGRSTVYDIAVLKSEGAKKLTPAAIGSADQMRVGETVVAIGSPLGLSATVTSGIISAVNRPVTTGEGANDNSYINAVQTDAAINPGNSGGPLVNLQGQVVGVNSAIASLGSQLASDQGGNIGVGFAIPIEQVRVTTEQILRTGKAQYPVIGANVRANATRDGATVESISPGAPAADAKLAVGDVILKVDGKPVTGSIDLVVAIRSHVPGEKVTLTVRSGGKTKQVEVGLDAKTG